MIVEIAPRVRDYSWSIACGDSLPDEGLLSVMRFSNHADPYYCKCGHTWGAHAATNVLCKNFRYDLDNPANRYKRDFAGRTDYPS